MTRQYPHHIDIVHLHAREASAAERLRSSRVIGNVVLETSRARFDSDLVVDCLSQALLTAKIFFRSLHRDVAQKELNLFQFAASTVTQPSARPSKVVRRKFQESSLPCVLPNNVPHHLFCHFSAPTLSLPTDATK